MKSIKAIDLVFIFIFIFIFFFSAVEVPAEFVSG